MWGGASPPQMVWALRIVRQKQFRTRKLSEENLVSFAVHSTVEKKKILPEQAGFSKSIFLEVTLQKTSDDYEEWYLLYGLTVFLFIELLSTRYRNAFGLLVAWPF